MVKNYTIGMLEKYDVFSSVKAGAEYVNGTFGKVTAGVFDAAAEGTYVIMQKGKGDTLYTDFTVAKDEDIRVADLTKWVGKQLQVSPAHIVYATDTDYSDLVVGTTKMIINSDGMITQDAASTTLATGDLYFEIADKIEFDGNGLLVTVAIA
jgi:hypothetical protein